jgi:prevent-host-death family protein
MKNVAASEFKARCLKLIDQVYDTGQPITITKRGKVVAVLQPAGHEGAEVRRAVRPGGGSRGLGRG